MLAFALVLATIAVVVEARSFINPLPRPQDIFLDHWKTLRINAGSTRSKRDACSDAHQAASSDKFGTCEGIIAKDLTSAKVSNSDVVDFCRTEDCPSYLYSIEEAIIQACPDDPGVSFI